MTQRSYQAWDQWAPEPDSLFYVMLTLLVKKSVKDPQNDNKQETENNYKETQSSYRKIKNNHRHLKQLQRDSKLLQRHKMTTKKMQNTQKDVSLNLSLVLISVSRELSTPGPHVETLQRTKVVEETRCCLPAGVGRRDEGEDCTVLSSQGPIPPILTAVL